MVKYFYLCYQKECFRRGLDAGKMYYYLEANGWKPVKDVPKADLIIIYTCGGFNHTEYRCVKTIKRVLDSKKVNTKVIVTGCILKINPESVGNFEEIEIIPDHDLYKLDDIIHSEKPYDEFPDPNIIPEKIKDIDDYSKINKLIYRFSFEKNFVKYLLHLFYKKIKMKDKIESSFEFNKDVFKIKISEGCLGKCTYCALKIAWGKLRSKPKADIIEEFKKGLELGFERFEFVSLDMGCYGLDIRTNIVDLLEIIFKEKRRFKLIMNDLNIHWLIRDDKFLPLLAKNKKHIEHIRIPIQSGSDKILKLMNRPYTKSEIYTVMRQIFEKIPEVAINTHFIVGFPGESYEDFLETAKLIDDFNFHMIDVFCYQDRPRVKSASLPNKLDKKVKIKRAQELAGKRKGVDILY